MKKPCKLALEDGTLFTGRAFGAEGTRTGEVVFNTAHTGYQEVFTDPSYCGQIVTMTFPLIGNYGVNPEDFESVRPHLSGFVVREVAVRPSNYRATAALADFLRQLGVIGLAGVDTRAITRRIRDHGALRGVISTEVTSDLELVRLAAAAPSMAGANLVRQVAPAEIGEWSERLWKVASDECTGTSEACGAAGVRPMQGGAAAPPAHVACHIVAIDCGIKHNILRHLSDAGARVTIAPAGTTAEQVLALRPDGLLVGNGPGDPAAVGDTIGMLRSLLGRLPVMGVCLGHQMLALALGATTYKLRFGHHGANVPVLNIPAGRVEITSQNHGFAVEAASLERAGGTVTHVNLNDQSLEGFVHRDLRAMAVQFHPEASPGPHDSSYLLRRFVETVREERDIAPSLLVAEPGGG
ncbi:MAG TPA: glutamine-hydrolyzing carbamoyl-phosphate synthase small subunit [Phycisphaerae bacterium]|nr:glutamine-hydrolyzing carbamoyl-phosphate synthase small subunit [Phycisphaerae bacterium]